MHRVVDKKREKITLYLKVLRGKPVKSKPRKTGGEVKKRDTRKREGVKRERKKTLNSNIFFLLINSVCLGKFCLLSHAKEMGFL